MGLNLLPTKHLKQNSQSKTFIRAAAYAGAVAALSLSGSALRADAAARVPLTMGHRPPLVYSLPSRGETDVNAAIGIELALRPRNADQIQSLLKSVKNPHDPLYGHYLTPAEYKSRFGRTEDEISRIVAFASRHNLKVVEVKPNNLLVRLTGKVADVESTFGIRLLNYVSTSPEDSGRIFHAPDREPVVDSDVAPLIGGIVGLDNAAVPVRDIHTTPTAIPSQAPTYEKLQQLRQASRQLAAPGVGPESFSYNGNQGLTPYDTDNIYGLFDNTINGTVVDGKGQTLGLAETGTFTSTDIEEYVEFYNIGNYNNGGSVPDLSVVSVDGYDTNSVPGGASGETELDLDMLLTDAYGASAIQVYEANDDPSSLTAYVEEFTDTFADMANASTRPNVISVSYGFPETQISESVLYSQGEALDQLALQGQTVCVSSGDSGAYADGTTESPNVLDPGDQPNVVCVGGTYLNDQEEAIDNSEIESYVSETSWYDPKDTSKGKLGAGSGGGISGFWDLPFFQQGSFSTSVNTQGSTTMRNTPDVTMFGDFDCGYYDVYFTQYNSSGDVTSRGWVGSNGTSAASPLWAGILADANQERVANKLPLMGEGDPDIYTIAESSSYGTDFHDIKDGSTNGYFKAVTGYDNSTGWGSPNNGIHLIEDLGEAPTYIEWGLATSATSVTSGKTLTGEIEIPLPASKNQTYALTSSNTSAFTVPSSVEIAKGDSSATFTITAKTVTASTKATLTATYYGYSESVSITVNPATSSSGLKSVSLDPTSTTGGTSTTANRVYWNGNAPANETVTLKSSNTNVATVPSSLTISSGSSSHTFTVNTASVTSSTNVTITATNGGTTQTATLTVTPSTSSSGLKSVGLSPTSTTGGTSTTANRVYWNGNAPANETVTLKSSNTNVATVPSTVTIDSGSSSHTFTITTKSVTSSTNVTITATNGSTTQTATLTVTPASTGSAVGSLTLSPTSVTGGSNSTGTVVLATVAPSGGTVVTLSTSNTSSTSVPSSVTVAAGDKTKTFTVETASVFNDTTATISASAGGVTKTATLTIKS